VAKLPTAADVIGRVQPQSLPGVRVPRDAFPDYDDVGETLGRAASNFGKAQLQENFKTEAQELSNTLNKKRRELLDGTVDKPGYYSLSGNAALEQRKQLETDWATQRDAILDKASNGAVSSLLRKNVERQNNLFLDGVAGHARAAEKQRDTDVYSALGEEQKSNSISKARLTDFTNRDAVSAYNGEISAYRSAAFDHYLKKTGVGDQARVLAAADVAELHKQVIEDMLIEQPLRAKAYFERYQSEIPEKLHDDLIKPIRVAADQQEALDTVADLKTNFGGLDTAAERRQAEAELTRRFGKDEKRLTAARKALDAETKRMDAIRDEEIEEHQEAARKIIADKRLAGDVVKPSDFTANQLTAMMKTQAGVTALQNAMTKAPLVPIDKSRVEFGKFLEEFDKMQKGQIPTMGPAAFEAKYGKKLNGTNYNQAVTLLRQERQSRQNDLEAGKRRAAREGISDLQRFKTSLTKAGLYITDSKGQANGNSRTRLTLFTERMDELYRQEARIKGDALTTDEKQAIIDRELLKIVYVEGTFKDKQRLGPLVTDEVADGDRVYVPYDKLTQNDINGMASTLARNNVTIPQDRDEKIKLMEDFAAAIRRGATFQQRFLNERRGP